MSIFSPRVLTHFCILSSGLVYLTYCSVMKTFTYKPSLRPMTYLHPITERHISWLNNMYAMLQLITLSTVSNKFIYFRLTSVSFVLNLFFFSLFGLSHHGPECGTWTICCSMKTEEENINILQIEGF